MMRPAGKMTRKKCVSKKGDLSVYLEDNYVEKLKEKFENLLGPTETMLQENEKETDLMAAKKQITRQMQHVEEIDGRKEEVFLSVADDLKVVPKRNQTIDNGIQLSNTVNLEIFILQKKIQEVEEEIEKLEVLQVNESVPKKKGNSWFVPYLATVHEQEKRFSELSAADKQVQKLFNEVSTEAMNSELLNSKLLQDYRHFENELHSLKAEWSKIENEVSEAGAIYELFRDKFDLTEHEKPENTDVVEEFESRTHSLDKEHQAVLADLKSQLAEFSKLTESGLPCENERLAVKAERELEATRRQIDEERLQVDSWMNKKRREDEDCIDQLNLKLRKSDKPDPEEACSKMYQT